MHLRAPLARGATILFAIVAPACSAPSGAEPPPTPATARAVVDELARTTPFTQRIADFPAVPGPSLRALDVILPREASAPLRVGVHGSDAQWVEVTPIGLSPVAAEEVEDAIVFRGASPHTDVVHLRAGGGAEEVRVLRAADAPSTARYDVRLGPGLRALRVRDERIEALDAEGTVQLATDPAFAIDARGERRAVHVELETPTTVRLSLETTGLAYPIAIDPVWTAVPSMSASRSNATASLLATGAVLVVGGSDLASGKSLGTTERYDPSANTWSNAAALVHARAEHTATRLPDGEVLVVGGNGPIAGGGFGAVVDAERYNPASNAWRAAGVSAVGVGHATVLLSSGKVLAMGGADASGNALTIAQLYDPSANAWTTIAPMKTARMLHTATTLSDGTVLVTGGASTSATTSGGTSSAELYDPVAATWSDASSMNARRSRHTAVLLPNGKVLVVGDDGTAGAAPPDLYNPVARTFVPTKPMRASRGSPTSNLFGGIGVLVAGGSGSGEAGSGEVYDWKADRWLFATYMTAQRQGHVAATLVDGRVLVAGGDNLASAELFAPLAAASACTSSGECDSLVCASLKCCDPSTGCGAPVDAACRLDSDCAAGSVCSAARTCVAQAAPVASGDGGGSGCACAPKCQNKSGGNGGGCNCGVLPGDADVGYVLAGLALPALAMLRRRGRRRTE